MASWRRAITRGVRWLLFGAIAVVLVAWAAAQFVDLSAAPARISARSYDGHVAVQLEAHEASVGVRYVIDRERGAPWSPEQATGAPDSLAPGDQRSAWATNAVDAPGEWLELSYGDPVIPTEIDVYENYSPGAVARIGFFDESGRETIVFDGTDPTPRGAPMGVSRIAVPQSFATRRVKLYLDSQHVPGWNEIDAVGLIDHVGTVHWATAARASSWYGSANYQVTADVVTPLLPRWSGLSQPDDAFASGAINVERRAVDAWGWPLPALWAAVPAPQTIGKVVPLHPLAVGFTLDALVFACVFAALSMLFTRPVRFLRRASRMQRGQCLQCGYDLRYDFVSGCPECGWQRDGAANSAALRVSSPVSQTQSGNGSHRSQQHARDRDGASRGGQGTVPQGGQGAGPQGGT